MSISQEMHDATKAGGERHMITVRCSAELHESLKARAWRRQKSLNQLCVDLLSERSRLDGEQ